MNPGTRTASRLNENQRKASAGALAVRRAGGKEWERGVVVWPCPGSSPALSAPDMFTCSLVPVHVPAPAWGLHGDRSLLSLPSPRTVPGTLQELATYPVSE